MAIAGQSFASTISTDELAAKLWQHMKGTLEGNLELFVEKALHKVVPQQLLTEAEEVNSINIHHGTTSEGILSEPCAMRCHDLSSEIVQGNGLPEPHYDMEEMSMSIPSTLAQDEAMSSLADREEGLRIAGPTQLHDEAKSAEECILPGYLSSGDPVDDFNPITPVSSKSLDSVGRLFESDTLSLRSSSVDTRVPAESCESCSLSAMIKWYWAFFGIIVWRRGICGTMYRLILFMALLSATILSGYNLIQQPWRLFENVAETAVSISSLLSLAACSKCDSFMGNQGKILVQYAASHHFIRAWNHRGNLLLVLIKLLWLCKAVVLSVHMYASEALLSWHALCTALAGLLQSGSYLAFIHWNCHVIAFLQFEVDTWADSFHRSADCDQSAVSWNVAQATMRHIAKSIETSFLAAQASSLITVLCMVARSLDIMTKSDESMRSSLMLTLLESPTMIIALCALVPFAKASTVTETSMEIPAVVNSLLVRRHLSVSPRDQAFVSFLHYSCAGVYVKGGRLNAAALMNYLYLCSAVICVLITTGLSLQRQR